MELSTENIPELSDMETEMHLAGFGAAASSYYLTQVLFSESIFFAEFGVFLASFFPLMYGYEMALEELKEYEL